MSDDSPAARLNRSNATIERDPAFQKRAASIARAKAGRQFRWTPGLGFTLGVTVVAIASALAWAMGWTE